MTSANNKNLVVGNWKMNLGIKAGNSLVEDTLKASTGLNKTECWIAPPYTAISEFSKFSSSTFKVGSQNVHWEESGAFTGELSVSMLKEAGVSFCITGHSERRQYFGETDETVAKRTSATLKAGLTCIACIGEKLEERESGKTNDVLLSQLKPILEVTPKGDAEKLVVAYEPVWAIGTGKTASVKEICETHDFINSVVKDSHIGDDYTKVKVLYGGSVKPANFAEIIAIDSVNGALVGGASLKAESYIKLLSISEDC